MNIGYIIIMIIEATLGIASALYLLVSLIGVIAFKFYRKLKYKMSWYD